MDVYLCWFSKAGRPSGEKLRFANKSCVCSRCGRFCGSHLMTVLGSTFPSSWGRLSASQREPVRASAVRSTSQQSFQSLSERVRAIQGFLRRIFPDIFYDGRIFSDRTRRRLPMKRWFRARASQSACSPCHPSNV